VALGYRENVNLAQIRTFTDMESHEEKVYKAMRETQEKEAKQRMMERAEEIRRQKAADAKGGRSGYSANSGGNFGGFGSNMSSSSSYSSSHTIEPTVFESNSNPPPSFSSSASSNKPSRAMKLGTNKDALPAFIEQQVQHTLPTSGKQHSGPSQSSTVSNTERYKPDEYIRKGVRHKHLK